MSAPVGLVSSVIYLAYVSYTFPVPPIRGSITPQSMIAGLLLLHAILKSSFKLGGANELQYIYIQEAICVQISFTLRGFARTRRPRAFNQLSVHVIILSSAHCPKPWRSWTPSIWANLPNISPKWPCFLCLIQPITSSPYSTSSMSQVSVTDSCLIFFLHNQTRELECNS